MKKTTETPASSRLAAPQPATIAMFGGLLTRNENGWYWADEAAAWLAEHDVRACERHFPDKVQDA